MWTAIKDYYERKDEAGKLLATEKFSQATMASTQLPIGAFCAELERLAKVLIMAGGEASEATIRTKLLASLLKEFDVVVTYIHESDTLPSLVATKKRLINYARRNGWEDLSTKTPISSKVYHVKEQQPSGNLPRTPAEQAARPKPLDKRPVKPTPPPGYSGKDQCKMFTRGMCRFGDACFRTHDGPGGCVEKPKPAALLAEQQQPIVTCGYCGEIGHPMVTCKLMAEHKSPAGSFGLFLENQPSESPSQPAYSSLPTLVLAILLISL